MISTKIVATIGPASDSVQTLQSMYNSGMRIARLNFSHGSHEYFEKVIKNIRKVSDEIGILLDTKGPEIRTGDVENGEIELCDRDRVILTSKKVLGNNKKLTVHYKYLHKLKIGDVLLIDDGLIEAKVIKKIGKDIQIRILNGGELGSKKSVIMRGYDTKLKFLSKKDKDDILFGVRNNVDFIAASYVKNEKNVLEIKRLLQKNNSPIKVISKIEHFQAIQNFDQILKVSNGIMVARGDLGIEIPMEKIPKFQKDIIKKCNIIGKPVIVATQMLESMKENPLPTRAEVSDVTQAILDGTDAIMLSGETASGKYPLRSVKFMQKIAKETDSQVECDFFNSIKPEEYSKPISTFMTKAAYLAREELNAKAIITPTESGFTGRKVSRFKPKCPIYAVPRNMTVLRQLQLSWGVHPIFNMKKFKTHDDMTKEVVKKLYDEKRLRKEDRIVITAGHIMAEKGRTNLVEVFKVEQILDNINQ